MYNVKELEKMIIEALEELSLPISVQDISENDSLQETHGFDSIMLLEYMAILEDKLNIEFDSDFDLSTLDSISSLKAYLISKGD